MVGTEKRPFRQERSSVDDKSNRPTLHLHLANPKILDYGPSGSWPYIETRTGVDKIEGLLVF
jgi:hypothetical protein